MIRINDLKCKATLRAAAVMSVFFLLAAVTGFGQQQVNLTAGPAATTLPDGNTVPMWGYSCGAVVTGSTATCSYLGNNATSPSPAAMGALGGVVVLNGGSGYTTAPSVTITPATGNTPTTPATVGSVTVANGQVTGITLSSGGAGYTPGATVTISGGGSGAVATTGLAWSPVLITVPAGTPTAPAGLAINLTNNLLFGTNNIPTSIVIVGQVGGGLGLAPTTAPGPDHSSAQGCVTWFIANTPPGTPCASTLSSSNPAIASPPTQGPRVRSMGTEVTAVAPGTTTTGTSLTWANLKPGTYLLESGSHPSIQVPMGLIGVLVVTTAPAGTTVGTAYPAVAATNTTPAVPAVSYNAEVPLEFSEIDPVQNDAVNAAVNTTGFSETTVWDGHTGACGDPSSGIYHTCYPPAVNYTPFYFLINGVAFSKANAPASQFPATTGTAATPASGTILVRLVNAGLRMHVPSIVGSTTTGFNGAGLPATGVGGFTVIAEDGTPVPNQTAPRVQTDVFMAAGKVFDVMVNVPVPATTTAPLPSLPVYARDLGLSANSSVRDSGMLAYIGVSGAALPVAAGSGVFAAAAANADTYGGVVPCTTTGVACVPFVVSDPSKGVIANDVNVYGVQLYSAPASGTVTCSALPGTTVEGICGNGTFTYTPNAGASGGTSNFDSFMYCANGAGTGTSPLCATVTLNTSSLSGPPTALAQTYNAITATYIKISSPGLLQANSDPNNLPLTLVTSGSNAPTFTSGSGTLVADPKGGFILTLSSPNTSGTSVTFNYTVQNSQGRTATGPATVIFPTPSNLKVHVLDAQAYANCHGNSTCLASLPPFPDYKWIIEEDRTFWVDPNCTTNQSATTPGCPAIVGPAGQSTVPTFGVNFHTSAMPYVAQGCTGPLSCEGGQTMLDTDPTSSTFGTHIKAVCDLGNGACRPDPTGNGFTPVNPSQVHLDPSKRYYISVLPGDAANPFPTNTSAPVCPSNGAEAAAGNANCGHTMSGASIPPVCNILGGANPCSTSSSFANTTVNVLVLPTPLPTGKLSVIVFEDDFPLNGEQDGGGGNGTIAPIEPGLGGFNIILWDTYGGLGDVTGQNSYDEFNQPLSNSLAGTIDPSTGFDACPISPVVTSNVLSGDGSQQGITGMIVTCPKYESDNQTLSPLAGQAVIANLMPEKFSVQAYPGADRIARGEQWVQTNTLDGQHPHDSFIRIGEPSYFQEYGPAGYHVSIGFANPKIINDRAQDVCGGFGTPGAVGPCTNTIQGQVDVQRLSRTPDQRLYPSGTRDALTWTQCWVSLGDPDGEDFMFRFCDAQGNFKFTNVPGGQWRLTIGDQWNDQIIDGLSTPANVGTLPGGASAGPLCPGAGSSASNCNLGNIGVQQWQSNVYTRTFVDDNHNGIWDPGEIGVPQVYARIYYRDGHNSNTLLTDSDGVANFNETFPLFNWYVVEADTTRYKTTGIHTVYDAGGPADGTCGTGTRLCGTSTAYLNLANTYEAVPLPPDLSVPGAVYCAKADCISEANTYFQNGTPHPSTGAASTSSTGRIDPPWVNQEGWSGMTSQGNWIEFGKAPYASCPPACAVTGATTTTWGENGGIHGRVAYASTRPFDDASQMIQQPWQPSIPNVTVNLYQEGFASDGVTSTLTLVDTTQTSSWDDWAQGFYPKSAVSSAGGGGPLPYMNCPGQGTSTGTNADLFFFTLYDQPNFLDYYNAIHPPSGIPTTPTPLPYNSQYKCYDSMHIWNQVQPAPYDGSYYFPSVLGIDPTTGRQTTKVTGGVGGNGPGTTGFVPASMPGTNCTICLANPTTATKPTGTNADYSAYDPFRAGTPMLPPGKYVVEVIMPEGYEVEKEEDKNLLIGDNFIGPATVQFTGLGGDIFIIPDQASVASMYDESGAGYNPSNYQNATTNEGYNPTLSLPGFPGFVDPAWPCAGELRVVPDYLSIYPQVQETAPFAGATRPLCDRKEVTLTNQMAVIAKFYIFTSTHIASKYAGVITDDFTSEFDPFSPQFGEKFAPPNLPVSTKDYLGNEISRVYSDHWGTYNGLAFSSWEVNPPNITGYSPSMMTQCMNDPGPIVDTRPGSPTLGQLITDPLYNPAYSDFCYEEPYMPGLTNYTDTPVVPTQAFVGAGYNNVDCSYPDATPAIAEVDGDGIGPWIGGFGHTITITALGNVQVNNSAYSGPSASVAPFNLKTVNRHYGFGSTAGTVTVGGVPLTGVTWSDTTITGTVNESGVVNHSAVNVPACAIQQQAEYGGPGQSISTYCGQLVITAANGKQSVDTVTVTIDTSATPKTPTHIAATASVQAAIDAAAPGDLLIVDPTCTSASGVVPCTTTGVTGKSVGSHQEMLIMWKPVRLQGVGAVSSVINANAFPAGTLLNPWRRHVNCLFGLSLQGVPTAPYDATGTYSCPDAGWNHFNGGPNTPQIDRLPLEATVGWDATQNGNLAEQLQEPSLMGAFEGAGITVLGKSLEFHGAVPWGDGNEGGAFPTVTTLLTGVGPAPTALPVGDDNQFCHTGTYDPTTGAFTVTNQTNPYPSNFTCNPSSIDGLTVTNSSQGGGGIFAHGWAHHLQIANNRVYNNAGTLTGGISVGQGEFPTPVVQGGAANAAPGSCSDGTGFITNQHLPYCLQLQVNVHHNYITTNSSLGDELFSGTLSGGGGATICTGNDYYLFNYNWVCGNLSAGEGGGLVHLGEIQDGDIEHNSFLFNQSQNPTIPTNGGAIQVMGTPDTDPVCGTLIDADCPPGLSDGIGHSLTINANLIQGNMAESGAGGGIRLQQVNGTDVSTFPGNNPITAADEGHTVRINTPASAILPSVGDSVTIAGLSVAGYNGTFTVIRVGVRRFFYLVPTLGLAPVNPPPNPVGTYTDTTTVGATAQPISSAFETGPGVITITSSLTPTIGDSVTITGVTPAGYNITCTVTDVPAAGTFTCNDPNNQLAAGTGGTVLDHAPNQAVAVLWNSVNITNNIIANNVAGWDGAGISLQDALNVKIVNNTIAHNDSLASSGVLTQSIGTPNASAPAGSCVNSGGTTSCNQSAGVTSTRNSTLLTTADAGLTLICPPWYAGTACQNFSNPAFFNNLVYQNRSFDIGVGGFGTGTLNQQKLVSLFDGGTSTLAPAQTSTGQCSTGVTYSDVGVRGGGFAINTQNSFVTDGPSPFISTYCNGSRVPPECTVADGCGGPTGYGVPPGIVDASTPNPVFSLTPSATVDEGNNWINVSWGPLSLSDPSIQGPAVGAVAGNWGGGLGLGNYALRPGTNATDRVPLTSIPAYIALPSTDFFGNPRPNPDGDGRIDVGAVETQGGTAGTSTLTSISPTSGFRNTSVSVTLTGTGLTGASAINVSGGAANGITVSGIGVVSDTQVDATFTISATAPFAARTVSVTTPNGTTNTVTFTVTAQAPTLTGISPTSGSIGATGIPVTLTGTNLTGATAITISGTGVSHGAITVNAAGNQITTTFSITRTAAVGARSVTVTTPGGTTNAETFTVTAAAITFTNPTLTSTPATSGTKTGLATIANGTGANVGPLTITGINVAGGTGGTFSIIAGGTCPTPTGPTTPFVLAAGASCTINVQYATGGSTATRSAHIALANSSGATVTPLNGATFNAN